ncbi:MAG: hypothetical protein ACYDG6_11305 [Thermincolia bacterium]
MNFNNSVLKYVVYYPLALVVLVVVYFLYAGFLEMIGIVVGALMVFWLIASPFWLAWHIYKRVRAR